MDDDKKKKKKNNNSKQVLLIIFIVSIFMIFSVGMSFSALDHYESSDTNYYNKRTINNIIARKKKKDEEKPVEPPIDEPEDPPVVEPKEEEKKPEPKKEKKIIFEFEENVGNGNVIKLYNQLPTADNVGKNFTGENYVFEFKIRVNENALGIKYKILNEKVNNSTLDNKYIKTYLVKNNEAVPSVIRTNGKIKAFNEFTPVDGNSNKVVLYEDNVRQEDIKKGYISFVYKMWVGDDYPETDDMINKTFYTRISVDAYEK